MDNIFGFENPCVNDAGPLWVLDASQMNYKDSKNTDINNVGILLHKLITENSDDDYKIDDHILDPIIFTMINNTKMISVNEIIKSFDELSNKRLIQIGGCRCTVPYSYNHISFDEMSF